MKSGMSRGVQVRLISHTTKITIGNALRVKIIHSCTDLEDLGQTVSYDASGENLECLPIELGIWASQLLQSDSMLGKSLRSPSRVGRGMECD